MLHAVTAPPRRQLLFGPLWFGGQALFCVGTAAWFIWQRNLWAYGVFLAIQHGVSAVRGARSATRATGYLEDMLQRYTLVVTYLALAWVTNRWAACLWVVSGALLNRPTRRSLCTAVLVLALLCQGLRPWWRGWDALGLALLFIAVVQHAGAVHAAWRNFRQLRRAHQLNEHDGLERW